MDGYPTKYSSFMTRLSRWIRGDWQIISWLGRKSPLDLLSKYKIFDNLRRSVFELSIIIALIYINIVGAVFKLNTIGMEILLVLTAVIPFILELLNYLIAKKEGEEKQKNIHTKNFWIKRNSNKNNNYTWNITI